MSDLSVATISALAAGGALLIAAFFAGIVSVLTAWRALSNKVDTVAKDTAVVLGHVNSEKSISEGEKNTLKSENALLREMLLDRKQTAALLAQAASHPAAAPIVIAAGPGGLPTDAVVAPTTAVLDRIEENTAATAAGVQSLKAP